MTPRQLRRKAARAATTIATCLERAEAADGDRGRRVYHDRAMDAHEELQRHLERLPYPDDGVGRAISIGDKYRSEAKQWYHGLKSRDRDRVQEWLRDNPPPDDWAGTRLSWAHTEMPTAFLPGFEGEAHA